MKRVLLQRLLCLLNHFLLLAEMIKEFRQKIKESCRPKNLYNQEVTLEDGQDIEYTGRKLCAILKVT